MFRHFVVVLLLACVAWFVFHPVLARHLESPDVIADRVLHDFEAIGEAIAYRDGMGASAIASLDELTQSIEGAAPPLSKLPAPPAGGDYELSTAVLDDGAEVPALRLRGLSEAACASINSTIETRGGSESGAKVWCEGMGESKIAYRML